MSSSAVADWAGPEHDAGELGIEAEKRFKTEIPETTLGQLTTVGDVLALIDCSHPTPEGA